MAKYTEAFKLKVAQAYLSGQAGSRALAAEHGLDHGTVRRWAHQYQVHGESGLRKKFSHYSAQFKLFVLRRMWQEELSCRQVAVLFDLRGGHGVVTAWERRYHEGGLDALQPNPRGRPKKMPEPKPPVPMPTPADEACTLEQLRKENEYLRAEVAYLKKLRALRQAKEQAAQIKRGPCSN